MATKLEEIQTLIESIQNPVIKDMCILLLKNCDIRALTYYILGVNGALSTRNRPGDAVTIDKLLDIL